MTAKTMKTPIGPVPIREEVRRDMEGKTDREIADRALGGSFIDPEYYAELCRRGLSGSGWRAKDTYQEIARREDAGAKVAEDERVGLLARALFAEAFLDNPAREPRSDEYKQGALAALRHQAAGRPGTLVSPYKAGTASADAWHAGVSEGRWRWHRWEDLNREG